MAPTSPLRWTTGCWWTQASETPSCLAAMPAACSRPCGTRCGRRGPARRLGSWTSSCVSHAPRFLLPLVAPAGLLPWQAPCRVQDACCCCRCCCCSDPRPRDRSAAQAAAGIPRCQGGAPWLHACEKTHAGFLSVSRYQNTSSPPSPQVAAHAEELPFLVGHPPQPLVDNKTQVSLSARAMIAAGLFPIAEQQQGVPAERAVALHGEGGDLADAAKAAGAAAKRALRWLPRGVLRWGAGEAGVHGARRTQQMACCSVQLQGSPHASSSPPGRFSFLSPLPRSFIKVGGHTPGSIAIIHAPRQVPLAHGAHPRPRWQPAQPTASTRLAAPSLVHAVARCWRETPWRPPRAGWAGATASPCLPTPAPPPPRCRRRPRR